MGLELVGTLKVSSPWVRAPSAILLGMVFINRANEVRPSSFGKTPDLAISTRMTDGDPGRQWLGRQH